MKNNLLKIAGVLTCVVVLGLSLQNAFDGYGVKKGNIHPEVLAQTNSGGDTSGGGSDSGGSSSGGDSSGGGSSSGGSEEMTCYSTYRITPKTKREPEWAIQACNDCTQVNCFEYQDASKCTKKTGVVLV